MQLKLRPSRSKLKFLLPHHKAWVRSYMRGATCEKIARDTGFCSHQISVTLRSVPGLAYQRELGELIDWTICHVPAPYCEGAAAASTPSGFGGGGGWKLAFMMKSTTRSFSVVLPRSTVENQHPCRCVAVQGSTSPWSGGG